MIPTPTTPAPQAGHTPGPWKWVGTKGHPNRFCYLSNSHGEQIGVCLEGFTDNPANARLIAAAPALLDVVKRYLGCLSHDTFCNAKGGINEAARAALAQAGGRA